MASNLLAMDKVVALHPFWLANLAETVMNKLWTGRIRDAVVIKNLTDSSNARLTLLPASP